MHSILQTIFDAFGKSSIGRIIASAWIGAIVTVIAVSKNGPQIGSWVDWALAGASMGVLAALFLVSKS